MPKKSLLIGIKSGFSPVKYLHLRSANYNLAQAYASILSCTIAYCWRLAVTGEYIEPKHVDSNGILPEIEIET